MMATSAGCCDILKEHAAAKYTVEAICYPYSPK